MPRIALLSDRARGFDPRADPRNVAMLRQRHAYWARLAELHGWDLALRDAASIDAPRALADSVTWIDLPMLPRASYGALFTRALAAGAAHVLTAPEDVERVLGLDRFHATLCAASVPTPRTALLPVDDAVAAAIDSPAAVRRLLIEAVYGALFDAGIDPHRGVFVRGFYSSAKSANPEAYYGDNQADLEATIFEVVRRLRVSLELGGLALREHLDLDRIELGAGRDAIRVPFEVRVTVLEGRALFGSYHGPFASLAEAAQEGLADALSARRDAIERALRALVPRLIAADLPPSYVADVAFVRGGEPVVLELNPLYAAGYGVPAAHALIVAALGAHLAGRAGYAEPSWSEVRDSAAALAGARAEDSAGVWVLP